MQRMLFQLFLLTFLFCGTYQAVVHKTDESVISSPNVRRQRMPWNLINCHCHEDFVRSIFGPNNYMSRFGNPIVRGFEPTGQFGGYSPMTPFKPEVGPVPPAVPPTDDFGGSPSSFGNPPPIPPTINQNRPGSFGQPPLPPPIPPANDQNGPGSFGGQSSPPMPPTNDQNGPMSTGSSIPIPPTNGQTGSGPFGQSPQMPPTNSQIGINPSDNSPPMPPTNSEFASNPTGSFGGPNQPGLFGSGGDGSSLFGNSDPNVIAGMPQGVPRSAGPPGSPGAGMGPSGLPPGFDGFAADVPVPDRSAITDKDKKIPLQNGKTPDEIDGEREAAARTTTSPEDALTQAGFDGQKAGQGDTSTPSMTPSGPIPTLPTPIPNEITESPLEKTTPPLEEKVDIIEDMKQLQSRSVPDDVWSRKIERFCKRFPYHPKCAGKKPTIDDLNTLLDSVNGSVVKFLPPVPHVTIRDPLANIELNLVEELNDVQKGMGTIGMKPENVDEICKRVECIKQSKQQEDTRNLLTEKMYEHEKQFASAEQAAADVQRKLDRVQQIKEALIARAGMEGKVVPADNGIFDLDQMLTEEQINFFLNELGKSSNGEFSVPLPQDDLGSNGRRKRASLFFEQNPVKKWDVYSPIQYTFDESLEEQNKADVRGAIKEIETKTCIRFKEVASAPKKNHIIYYKVDSPTFCGLSYVGMNEDSNPIYLSFACENSRGVAIHETLHALGVAHQHLRMDRDQHIGIDWRNVNPQQYDAFVIVDAKMYTTYGVKYDYGSIMHYQAHTAAIDDRKATMIPKIQYAKNVKLLGQRKGMSASDVELVTKMYCQKNCDDKNVYCGAWAIKGMCKRAQNKEFMTKTCRKSCNLCS